jgi:hypothetical protein
MAGTTDLDRSDLPGRPYETTHMGIRDLEDRRVTTVAVIASDTPFRMDTEDERPTLVRVAHDTSVHGVPRRGQPLGFLTRSGTGDWQR